MIAAVGLCVVAGRTGGGGLGGGTFVHFFREFVRSRGQGLHGGFHGLDVVPFHGGFHAGNSLLNFGFLLFGDFLSMFFEVFFRSVNQRIGLIADFDGLTTFFIFFRMGFGFLDQLVDFFFAESA